jgi:3-methyladenine DNA glycosylase AlkD
MFLTEILISLSEPFYKEFQSKLMPGVPNDSVLGVRTPLIRGIAKKYYGSREATEFILNLPHVYYEENNLHAFIIEQIKDFDEALYQTDRFLPFIDNWATCDSFLPIAFKKDPKRLKVHLERWLKSENTYTVRYAVKILMQLFLDDLFEIEQTEMLCLIRSEEYYVKMAIAWYFATALAKQYETAVKYIEQKRLPVWTHNKAIQKAIESHRISAEIKEYLKTLKIK